MHGLSISMSHLAWLRWVRRIPAGQNNYLKVTIICRYIFLRFWFKTCFVNTKFCVFGPITIKK